MCFFAKDILLIQNKSKLENGNDLEIGKWIPKVETATKYEWIVRRICEPTIQIYNIFSLELFRGHDSVRKVLFDNIIPK